MRSLAAGMAACAAQGIGKQHAGVRDAELTRQIARNDASAKGLITELAQLGDSDSPAAAAYRARIREHFEELHAATETLKAELAGLQDQADQADPADLIN